VIYLNLEVEVSLILLIFYEFSKREREKVVKISIFNSIRQYAWQYGYCAIYENLCKICKLQGM
jgi:hypothetical protein